MQRGVVDGDGFGRRGGRFLFWVWFGELGCCGGGRCGFGRGCGCGYRFRF